MASTQLVDNFTNSLADTPEEMYAATYDTIIDSFTAANTSSINASYTAYIVSPDGNEAPQIPYKIVVWGENDLGIGIVGQTIPAGSSLKVESSAINSIYFTVSGRPLSDS